ncbi:C-type mannose receptor 2-like [Branchiostoma floridae x Branchiostoma japonicum]
MSAHAHRPFLQKKYRYRQTSLVSYAVGGGEHANELLLFNDVDNGGFQLWVRNVLAGTVDLPVWDGAWHEICATWRSSGGHWQIFSDGALRASGSGLNMGGTVRRGGTWILGQDQDTVGGAFVESQAFSGELSQVNLWDRALSSDEIGTDWSVFCKHHGNVIDWATANINISGLAGSDQYLCGTYSKPIDCPDDYQPFQGICYKAYSVTATFHESLRACSEDGGTLAIPRDKQTNDFLVGLKNSVDQKSSFWFGLHDSIEENVWKWIDGEELGDFTDWGPGEPNDYKQRNEDCVVYYPPKKNKWNDMPCLNKLKFICQVDTTGYTPYVNEKIAFKVFAQLKTYEAAKQTCASDGGHLADLKTQALHNFVLSMIQNVDASRDYWIGLNDMTVEGTWTWSDGTPVSHCAFANWVPGEPNNAGTGQDCGQLWTEKGFKWDDDFCGYQQYFICQKGSDEEKSCDNQSKGYTPYVNEKIAFKVFAQLKTYEAAKQTCASDGGHLADLKTQALHNFVLSMIQNVDASRDYWIGLNDITVEGTWTWSDGTPISHCAFANWMPGEPNNAGTGQDCGRLWKDKGFKWDDYKCGYQKYFICQKGSDEEKSCDNQPKDKSTYVRPQSTLELFYHKADCPEDYLPFQGICYKAFNVTATFHQSLRACSEDGGTLAMPRDKETNDFLVGLKNSIDQRSSFWFGLHDSIEENVWKWIDGEELGDFTDWGPGEPNNAGGEDCVVYIPPKKNKWNDMPCLTKLKFICQVDTTEAVLIRSSSNDVHYDGKAVLESPVFSTNCSNSSLVFHYRMQGSVVPATLYVSIVSNESNSDSEMLGTFPFELTDGEKDQVHLDLQREQPFRVVFTAELDHHSANSTDSVGQIQLYDVVVLDKCRPIDGSAQAVLFKEPAPSKVPVLSNGQSLPNGAIIGIIVALVIVAVAIATGVVVARRMRGQYDRFMTTSTTVLMMRDNVMFEPDVE